MLKYLAILVLLVATISPIPGQTANKPAGGGGHIQEQGAKSQPNGQPAATALPQSSTRPSQANAENPDAENTGNSVTVSKLPTVSIGKDWADWSYWGFGGLLVIVGGSQVWFLFRTLKAIQTQAGHMERQTKALEDSVGVAQKAADAAEISAKAAMGVAIPTLVLVSLEFAEQGAASFAAKLQYPVMRVVVKNYGQTPAILKSYGVKYSCDGISPSDSIPPAYHFEASDVIEAGQEYVLEDAAYARWQPFSVEDIVLILNKKKILGVAGCLRYGDVFDSPIRELVFCKELADFRSEGTDPLWVGCDQGEKYRASTEDQQHFNPN